MIDADEVGNLTVDPVDGFDLVNSGILRASDGGTLILTPTTIDNSTVVIEALNGSSVVIQSGAWIIGGSLDSEGSGNVNATDTTLERVTIDGNATINAATLIESLTLNGALTPVGGTLDLDQSVTLKGNGTLMGNLTNAGTVRPGQSLGTLSVQGDYSQAVGGTLTVEVNATQSDVLSMTGTASIDGTLRVALQGAFPSPGTSFTVLTAGSVMGAFNSGIIAPCGVTVTYEPTQIRVTIEEPELDPPDLDDNLHIDIVDFVLLTQSYGSCVGCLGDRNCNDEVDVDDVLMVLPDWSSEIAP